MSAEAGLTHARPQVAAERKQLAGRPVATPRFHWTVALLSGWFVLGAYLDAWAHSNIAQLETFFTPWHGVLYSGAAATMLFVAYSHVRNYLRGHQLQLALPDGYGLTLAGLLGFAIGGIGDMLWHTAFGIERDVEAAISPTHLLLVISGLFVVSGPLRAGWRRARTDSPQGLAQWGPVVLSLTLTLMWLMTLPQVLHPLVRVYAASGEAMSAAGGRSDRYLGQVLGAASILLNTTILMGLVLLAVRRWRLPPGALTFMFTVYGFGLCAMQSQWRFIPGVIATGLTAEALLRLLKVSTERPLSVQIFAFAVPVVFHLAYFLTLSLSGGTWWTIHMWLGMTFISGLVGVLLTMLLLPSWQPAEQPA